LGSQSCTQKGSLCPESDVAQTGGWGSSDPSVRGWQGEWHGQSELELRFLIHPLSIASDVRHEEARCPFCHSPGVSQAKPGQAQGVGDAATRQTGSHGASRRTRRQGRRGTADRHQRRAGIQALPTLRDATGSWGQPPGKRVCFAAAGLHPRAKVPSRIAHASPCPI